MGDRCHLEVTFRQEDRDQFLEFMGGWKKRFDDEFEDEPGVITAAAWEANYACHCQLETLATHGVPFYGQHSAGGTYPEGVFASAGGAFVACDAFDGVPAVSICEDGTPDSDRLATARRYWRLFRRAKALLKREEGPTVGDRAPRIYWVDLPNPNDVEGSWINVAEFCDRDEAITFCQERYGADEEGRIGLIVG